MKNKGKSLAVASIQDYEVVCPLGRGAYSYVYKVKLRHSQQEFALKIIDKGKLRQSNISKRLMNEIKLQSQLNHPCIVKLHHYFEDQENVYLLLELCAGGEFFTYIKTEGHLDEEETRCLVSQLVEGLTFLHNKGILHRDLKLGNLLLSEDRTQLKIADFGLAVQLNNFEEERYTLCGTPNYLSPEIVTHKPYGLAADLWALGCIIYACLVGYPPFESPSIQATILKLKEMKFALPNTLSDEARDLISALLIWDFKERLNIYQVRSHEFFHNLFVERVKMNEEVLEPDCSYYEYSESIVTPHRSKRKPLRELNSQTIRDNETYLAPISTQNLKAIKHRTPRGELEITDDGWVKVTVGNKTLEISPDGMTVLYQGSLISLKTRKRTPLKLYQYARNFIEVVESKTPKLLIEDENAVYMLMRNTPFPNFEVDFRDGVRVSYQVGNEVFTVHPLAGGSIDINPYQDLGSLNSELYAIIEKSMRGLKRALMKEREVSNS